MAIDMSQFHQVFYEESIEGLERMEQSLLELSNNPNDGELVNTIFRVAHSIKGGSATFGFSAVADFTHVMETLLDEVRDNKRPLTDDLIELLLKSGDCLRQMIAALEAGQSADIADASDLIATFEGILAGADVAPAQSQVATQPEPQVSSAATAEPEPIDVLQESISNMLNDGHSDEDVGFVPSSADDSAAEPSGIWNITFIPEPQILLTGNEPVRLFRELEGLGSLRATALLDRLPSVYQLTADECYLGWTLELDSNCSKEDIEEVFEWVIDECQLTVERGSAPTKISEPEIAPLEPEVVAPEPAEATGTKSVASEAPLEPVAKPQVAGAKTAPTSNSSKSTPKSDVSVGAARQDTAPATSSIRVGIDKVDSLINLVGELVITQSMLSELGRDFDMTKVERLSAGLEQLLQNTKELQESVMRIRMLPISFAFNRFPRMVRDLATRTNKQVELQMHGENTELDKTVMEQVGDPLVHLVRNALDHGIESPEDRVANGKSEQGTVKLDAYHQGGNIVIEVSDDGAGINRDKILSKAIERGLVGEDAGTFMSDGDVFDLIFEPGFSTAVEVSDISGRGVGMDVVKRNIKSLGGRIQVESALGKGSVFRIHLPLTLAILDGQLVKVGQETYVIPLISIVESLQVKDELVNRVSGGMVLYRLREDNVPIIKLHKHFNLDGGCDELNNALLVVVEAEGTKIGLLVDDLLAQQQVVIKSLQDNYRQVEGISGATILGDGSVAMILDVAGLIEMVSGINSGPNVSAA